MKQVGVYRLVDSGAGGLARHDTMTAIGIKDGIRLYHNRALDHDNVEIKFDGGADLLKFGTDGSFLVGVNSQRIGIVRINVIRIERKMRTVEIERDRVVCLDVGRRSVGLSQSISGDEGGLTRLSFFEVRSLPLRLDTLAVREIERGEDVLLALVYENIRCLQKDVLARFVVSSKGESAELIDVLSEEWSGELSLR